MNPQSDIYIDHEYVSYTGDVALSLPEARKILRTVVNRVEAVPSNQRYGIKQNRG